ncbi:MAG: OsmC family protein [Oceanospirillaceae bacterium]|nr:OsmC family protein [Oceanospirillaceae bacterium]
MQKLPHQYRVSARAADEGSITTDADNKPSITVAAPAQFGGPGDCWSPEELLMAAIADCLVLTFRAVARASKLEWRQLDVRSTGILDRIDGETRFTEIHTEARLGLAPGQDRERAIRLLEKAEGSCLITRSLRASTALTADIHYLES